MSRAFTLIELLIVVAIIAILAAIAVPNFLEAQTRSKVSRVKADFRSLATALESYGVDYNRYPPSYAVGLVTDTFQFDLSLAELTTPVAYMTSTKLRDPFNETTRISNARQVRPLLMYFNYEVLKPFPPYQDIDSGTPKSSWRDWASTRSPAPDYPLSHRAFSLWSPGPDKNDNSLYHMENDAIYNPNYLNTAIMFIYDPTNGTVSGGDIMRLSSGAKAGRLPLN